MSEGLRVRKRFLTFLICGAALGLLIVSGLSCVGRIIYPESPAANWLPATQSEFTSYVMPECQAVNETLETILGDPPYTISQLGFDDIRSWVADNIAYKSDKEQWGRDYWQTPEETLLHRAGDCEDFSILLCSLLRAYGIDAQRVYVALGINGAQDGHAFVIENWYNDVEWRRVESQAAAQLPSYSLFFTGSYLDSRLDKYEIWVVFNDLYWYDGSFSSEMAQEDSSTLADILTATGDILERLLRLLGSLLGLLLN